MRRDRTSALVATVFPRPRAPAHGRPARPVIVLLVVTLLLSMIATTVAEAPADGAFQRTWERTDQPVAAGLANRTWMWGPEAFTGGMNEQYAETPGGQRLVQYFDKARMEITNPGGDATSVWYVTNGLLVVELITGRLQRGNDAFDPRGPAAVNVAGDADDPSGPTYATFAGLLNAPTLAVGAPVTLRVNRESAVTDDPALAARGVSGAFLDDVTNHTIAGPFWSFMNSTGMVREQGANVTAPLFENAFFATGRPITEAYWANVKVADTYRDVLMQCFERRCLTYAPDNPEGWQVEAGNVGRHYYSWRYDSAGAACPWGEPFPAAMTIGDVVQTTMHFEVEGCNVALTQLDIKTSDQHTRGVTFDPPMRAWSAGPTDAPTWQWESSGSFSGETHVPLGAQTIEQRQQGSYSATMRAYVTLQANGPIFWIEGQWWESGTNELCAGDDCRDLTWSSPHSGRWFWAVNTASGAVGVTPTDVR